MESSREIESLMRINVILIQLGASILITATVAVAQGSHPDFSGFWEAKYTGGSGAFIDVFAFEDPCDSGDPKEYQSVLGLSVIGATSVYEQNQPPQK
jgi:hypothetical protein